MSLVFRGESAHLVGRTALMPVKCLGSHRSLCSGTLTLTVSGAKHEAPFSVLGGSGEDLTVPVGSAAQLIGKRAVVVARTAQAVGPFARSTAVVHFR